MYSDASIRQQMFVAASGSTNSTMTPSGQIMPPAWPPQQQEAVSYQQPQFFYQQPQMNFVSPYAMDALNNSWPIANESAGYAAYPYLYSPLEFHQQQQQQQPPTNMVPGMVFHPRPDQHLYGAALGAQDMDAYRQQSMAAISGDKRQFDNYLYYPTASSNTDDVSNKRARVAGDTGSNPLALSQLPHDQGINRYETVSPSSTTLTEQLPAVKTMDVDAEKPRRPLTAYNFFFSEERERILASLPEPDACNHILKKGTPKNVELEDKNTAADSNTITGESSTTTSKDATTGTSKGAPDEASEEKLGKLRQLKELLASSPKLSTEEEAILQDKVKTKTQRILDIHREGDRAKRTHKKEHGKVSFRLLCTLVGERWRALPVDRREYYNELSKTDLERYRNGMKDFSLLVKNHRQIQSATTAL